MLEKIAWNLPALITAVDMECAKELNAYVIQITKELIVALKNVIKIVLMVDIA